MVQAVWQAHALLVHLIDTPRQLVLLPDGAIMQGDVMLHGSLARSSLLLCIQQLQLQLSEPDAAQACSPGRAPAAKRLIGVTHTLLRTAG